MFLITVLSTGSYFMSKLYLKSYKKDFKAYVFQNKKTISYTKIEIKKNQLYKNSKDLALGETIFKATCVACHGNDAKGNQKLGAPNLTDEIWLYGETNEELYIAASL